MGAVVSSLGSAAASGLTNLVALGLLSWTAAAAIKACEGSLDDESGGGEWRLVRCVLAAENRVCDRGGKPRAGLAEGLRKLRSPRDGGTATSSSRRPSLDKQSRGGASCRSPPSPLSPASFGGDGNHDGDVDDGGKASSPPALLASTGRRNDRGGVDDDADGDHDDDDDDSVERSSRGRDEDDDEWGGSVRLAVGCAQLDRAASAQATRIAHHKPGWRRAQLRQSGCERAASSASRESASCVAGSNCAIPPPPTDAESARSAARSSPCRFYYCSSSHATNAGDDRASAPQQSRMLSIAPAAATATKSAAASTRMTTTTTTNNNNNNISSSSSSNNNNNKHTTGSDNISKIRLQINRAANKNSKQAPIENPNQIPHLAMEPIGGCGGGRQRSIVIKSRQTQFAQTKSAASSLDSGHSGSNSSGRGSHSDLSLASSNIINNIKQNNNNNNNNNEEEEEEGEEEDLDEDYTKSSSNMLHPTVSALLQSTANLTLARHQQQPQNHYELVVDVDTPPPSPLKRSKKMQMLHAGDQLSPKHQRTSFNQQQQQVAQVARRQEHQHQMQGPRQILHETNAAAPASDSRQYRQLSHRPQTQDATYLAQLPSRNHLIELLAAARSDHLISDSRPPPRPWLSPAQQLQFLSKGRLRQLFQEGRIDRHQYEHLLEFRPSRRCATKSKWGQQQLAHAATTLSDNQTTADVCRGPKGNEFTVLSYNVLSDRMVNPSQFPSSPDLALNWLYRSELILRQLLDHDADIVALQELEMEQFESFFRPKLEELGHYSGLFESKSRARTMDSQMRKRVDGCAIFYKRNKFKLIGKHLLEFNQIAMANSHGSEAMLNRVMTRDNIGLVAVLELVGKSPESASGDSEQRHPIHNDLDDDDDDNETFLEYSSQMHTSSGSSRTTSTSDSISSRSTSSAYRTTTSTTTTTTSTTTSTSKRIIVCNTHIHWDPNYCDVKLIQTIMLMNELKHIARHYRLEAAAEPPVDDGATRAAQLDESKLKQAQKPSADNDDDDDDNVDDSNDDEDDLRGESLVPLVLLGDFNSMQKSGVVQFLLNGAIDSSHKDFKEFKYTPCKTTLTLLGRRQRQREAQQQQLHLQRLAGLNQNHLLVSRRASDQAAQALSRGRAGPSGNLLGACGTRLDTSLSLARRQSSPLTCSSDSSQTSSPLPHSPLVAPPGGANANCCPQGLISYEHPFKLASAYEKGVMPFTNYCTHFKATIDYIFYDDDQIQLLASLGPLDKDWLKRSNLQGFPQMDFPSDHLPLMAKFRLLSVDDFDDYDDRSSLSQISSIETTSSAKLTTANNNWRPQQQQVAPVGAKPNAAQVAAATPLNQQRNQRKQLLYINQNLRKKPQQQQQQQQLVTAAAVAALPRTSNRPDEHTQTTWYRLRRDSPPTAATNQQQQQEARLESRIRQQGSNNYYHCYLPQHNLKHHIERQLQQNQAKQQQQQQQLRMQFIKERVESCNQIKTNTLNDNNDNQDGIKQAAAAANSRRPAKQSSRRQLQKKLKQIRPEKVWPSKPLLVKLKEDWS